jgi:hypothetical protein
MRFYTTQNANAVKSSEQGKNSTNV